MYIDVFWYICIHDDTFTEACPHGSTGLLSRNLK